MFPLVQWLRLANTICGRSRRLCHVELAGRPAANDQVYPRLAHTMRASNDEHAGLPVVSLTPTGQLSPVVLAAPALLFSLIRPVLACSFPHPPSGLKREIFELVRENGERRKSKRPVVSAMVRWRAMQMKRPPERRPLRNCNRRHHAIERDKLSFRPRRNVGCADPCEAGERRRPCRRLRHSMPASENAALKGPWWVMSVPIRTSPARDRHSWSNSADLQVPEES